MEYDTKTNRVSQQMPFITPEYECDLEACFQITEQTLENLKLDRVPSGVLKKLESIKNQVCFTKREYQNFLNEFPHTRNILNSLIKFRRNKGYIDIGKISDSKKEGLGKKALDEIMKQAKEQKVRVREKFLDVLRATIGDRQTNKHRSSILKHAKISDNKTYTVDVTLSAPPQTFPSPIIDKAIDRLIDYFKIYKIKSQNLRRLKSEGVSGNVLKKLEGKKNQEIRGKGKFLEVLKATIGDEQTVKYESLILEHVKCFRNRKHETICDFGAGKLRNTEPFLNHRFRVYAVDYRKQFQYKASLGMLSELRRNFRRRFRRLYPNAFVTKKLEFDAVLLIFVIHIIPSLEDRNLIIECCSEKLRKGGLLIWVTPYGDTNMRRHCKAQFRYEDGWILHAESGSSKQTFYTEFRVPQIDEMVEKHAFKFNKRLDFFKNKARIYEKI